MPNRCAAIRAAAAGLALLAASGCGAGGREQTAPPRRQAPAAAAPPQAPHASPASLPVAAGAPARAARPRAAGPREPACGRARALRFRDRAYGAVVRRAAAARAVPGGRVVARFGRLNVNGVPTVLGVLARCGRAWYRVQLPIRPNGATGWVRAQDVRLVVVRTSIAVDLSQRRLTLRRHGRVLLTAPVAIGAPATPTPTGSYYVNQRLVAPDPGGPYGPAAVGISAFSPVLVDWTQGGPIAIHGTNRPDLVGLAVSHGCVRLRNEVLRRVYALAEPGTPVLVTA